MQVTFNGGCGDSDDDDEDLNSEDRALRAERGSRMAQTRSEHNFASARITLVNGHEGEGRPDVRQAHSIAVASLQDSASFQIPN